MKRILWEPGDEFSDYSILNPIVTAVQKPQSRELISNATNQSNSK